MDIDDINKTLNIQKILDENNKKRDEEMREMLQKMREENQKKIDEIIRQKDEELKKKEEENQKKVNEIINKKDEIINKKDEIIRQKDEELKREKEAKIDSNQFDKERNSKELQKDIDTLKLLFSDEEKNEIIELQELLMGNNKSDIKFENYNIKRSFDYKFGNNIDNKAFISFIKEGLSTLYSDDDMDEINKEVFKFFTNIHNYIQDFLYIPMLKNNTLYEFKKYIYLAIISNQLKIDDYDSFGNYIFYDESYFNESLFKEITLNIEREKLFLKNYPEYEKTYQFKLNFDIIKQYMFSPAVKEAYLETCKDIFGKDAKFVTKENIDKALDDIYENIIKKNIKFVKLERCFYGITLHNKKILITNSFQTNLDNCQNERIKVSLFAGLIMTILHEVSHCLTNCLPLYSEKYEKLSNPFIRSFKKNITTYNLVTGKTRYEYKKINVFDILREKIPGYELIKDSGNHFEKKLFKDIYTNNYLGSEYLLKIENLNQNLKEFNDNFKKFEGKVDSTDLNLLNNGTSVNCRGNRSLFYYGRCLLDPDGVYIMK